METIKNRSAIKGRLRRAFAVSLLLSCLLSVDYSYASSVDYEQDKVTVTIKGGETTIEKLFTEFQRQTKKIIVYNNDSFDAKRKINASFENAGLDAFMNKVLEGTAMTYKIEKDYIVIVKKAEGKAVKQGAEKRTVSGVVLDAKGETLPGASVMVTGTKIGESSGLDGDFTITVPNGAQTLTVSSIGMTTQIVPIEDKMRIVLKEDLLLLDEVVVVGYNTVKKSSMTGAIDVVAGKKIERASATSLESRLQGQVSGLMIIAGSGQPGSENIQVRVRGTGSMLGSSTPMYIMDGVMIEAKQFASLNPNDIADVQVLKDAASTAIYGSRGANGVIVITTKGGKEGKIKYTYSSQYGFSKFREGVELMNSAENIEFQRMCAETMLSKNKLSSLNIHPLMRSLAYEMKENAGTITAEELKYLDQKRGTLASARATDTDWMDTMTENGFTMEQSLSASGGTEKTRFFISGSYLTQKGIMKESGMKRYSGRLNITSKPNKYLEYGVKFTIGYSEPQFTGSGFGWTNPWFTSLLAFPYEDPDNWFSKDNPTLLLKYRESKNKELKMIGAAYVNVNITDWLSAKTNFGMDYRNQQTENTVLPGHPTTLKNNGSMSLGNNNLTRYTWTNTLNVNKTFGDGHVINGVVGMEMFQGKSFRMGYTGYDIDEYMWDTPAGIGDKNGSSSNPPSISGSRTMSNLMSYFAQLSYTLDNKYIVSGSLRYDSSSKFQKENRSQVFYSFGASWNIHSEKFMESSRNWLDQLKLRASYGTTGNQDGVNDFGTYDGYMKTSYAGITGYRMNQLGNPALKWECSEQFDVGVDFGMFNSRLRGSVDFYHKRTKDLFMSKEISQTSGFRSILTNAGSIVNKGVEIAINAGLIRTNEITWDLGVNFTYNNNKITELSEWNKEGFVDGDYFVQEGTSLGTWYMKEWAGVDSQTGDPLFVGKNGQKTPIDGEAVERMIYGTSEVPYFGGIHTTFGYKGFSLYAMFSYALDYTIMNGNRWFIDNPSFNGNKPRKMMSMWMKPGDITDVPSIGTKYNPSPWASQFLEDGTHIRLKTLRLSYDFSQKLLARTKFITGVSIYAQAENLWTGTKYSGSDPQVNGGTDSALYPSPFTMTFGLDINF
ncbi:MAG: TonB-dependent receptor [Bacteroidales bacterium]